MSKQKTSLRSARRTARPEQVPALPDVPRPDGRRAATWLWGLPVVCWAALAAGAVLGRHFDYDLWDNFEYFTPIITYAHGLWLKGIVPLWNPHQHLGEPILAAGQPGVLYVPYTLSVLLTRVLGLGPTRLMLMIVLVHLPVTALGWFLLMRRLGVRPTIAAVAAMCASLGGFITSVSTVWIFMQAVSAWLPWILYGIVRQLSDPAWPGAAAVVGGLVATAFLGHPQMMIYQWLTAGIFLVSFGLLVHRHPVRLIGVVGLLAWAGVLSLPALLPMGELLALSVRTRAFSFDEFIHRGVDPSTLVGWLLPVFKAPNGFLPDRASVMGYQGAWIVPAVATGLLSLKSWPRETTGRAFGASVLASALLLALAVGGHSPLYRATYGIPLWSSLRWPFKLFLMSQGGLVLAAGLGLELWARRLAGARYLRAFPVVLFVLAAAIAAWRMGVEPDRGRVVMVGLLGAAATLAALPWIDRRWGCVLLGAGAFVSAASLTASAHDMSMKVYAEPYGRTGARELGLRTDARVLPLTTQDISDPQMEPLALLHSATANGYRSATGTTAGLVPTWYAETLPCNTFGVPPPQVLRVLLASHLLRSFNIGYLVLGPHDAAARALVETVGGFTLLHSDRNAVVYEVQGVLPRAYFASRIYPFDPEGFGQGMLLNRAPVDAAFVTGWTGSEAASTGRVTAARWGESRFALDVQAPDGGFLVVSESDFPGWSCRVDGKPVPIARVNGRVMGIVLPRGARQVRLEIHSDGLRWGLGAALLGGLFPGVFMVFPRRARVVQTGRARPAA
jgi:hypothetical protein